jgi:hypothetical protein
LPSFLKFVTKWGSREKREILEIRNNFRIKMSDEEFDPMLEGDEDELDGMTIKDAIGDDVEDDSDDDEVPLESERE